MFVVYSKKTGDIKNIATGDRYRSLKDLFPSDFMDFELIYDFITVADDNYVLNNFHLFKVENMKIKLKNSVKKYT